MKPPTKKAGTAFVLLSGALAFSVPAGCFALGAGLEPPDQQFYYPTAIITSPGGHALYVVNSDFDIQYTGGTVQAVDLEGLRRCIGPLRDDLAAGISAGTACTNLERALFGATDADNELYTNGDPVTVPGPCNPVPADRALACTLPEDDPATEEVEGGAPTPLIRSSRVIGAFASSAALVRDPDPAATDARLFVAVRGDPSVTYFQTWDDGHAPEGDFFRLDCDADAPEGAAIGGRCSSLHRIGDTATDSSRNITLTVEPIAVAASDDGRTVVTVHQTAASASLVINKWGVPPTLEHSLGGLADGPSDVTPLPTPALIAASSAAGAPLAYQPGFLVTYRASRNVDIVRSYDDSESTIGRHFLQRVASFPVLTNSDGSDSRGVAIDDTDRRACEAGCEGEIACLRGCLSIPLAVFVANRSPASLLVGKIESVLIEEEGTLTAVTDKLSLADMVPLTSGPSRVVVGDVLDADGRRAPRVFVVSFDSRYVVIYDPRLRRVEASVRTGRGPQALAVDVAPDEGGARGHALLYVAHFTDSYIGVVDLDTRNTRTYGSMFATVGQPTPPKDSN